MNDLQRWQRYERRKRIVLAVVSWAFLLTVTALALLGLWVWLVWFLTL